jgi:hypothetical protein
LRQGLCLAVHERADGGGCVFACLCMNVRMVGAASLCVCA